MQMKFHEEFHNLGRIQERICSLFISICISFFKGYWKENKIFVSFEFVHFFVGMHIHGLAHAASGYHRVLEENRKLYNQVQDLKGKKINGVLLAVEGKKITECLKLKSSKWINVFFFCFFWFDQEVLGFIVE